jgi:hypothetical protein
MAANTTSVQAAMFAIARHCGDVQDAFVTSVTTPATVFVCAQMFQNLFQTNDDAFNQGLIRMKNGTVIAGIADYVGSTRTFTLLSPGLVGITAGGNGVEFIGFHPGQRNALYHVINETIRESWSDGFYVETQTDRADAVLTLASGTNEYALPTACSKLLRVGIQRTTRDGIVWFDPMQNWRVAGEEGALILNFLPGFAGNTTPAWSSRVRQPGLTRGTFADAFANEPLCLHYIGREPEVTGETGTTKLPMYYMEWVGAELYLLGRLATASDNEKRMLNVLLPQIQNRAAKARAQLRLTKQRIPTTVELDF